MELELRHLEVQEACGAAEHHTWALAHLSGSKTCQAAQMQQWASAISSS
jgi:hypothetical protein